MYLMTSSCGTWTPPSLAVQHLAVPADEQHLVRPDLLGAEPGLLHPDAPALGVAGGDVAPDQVSRSAASSTRQPREMNSRGAWLTVRPPRDGGL